MCADWDCNLTEALRAMACRPSVSTSHHKTHNRANVTAAAAMAAGALLPPKATSFSSSCPIDSEHYECDLVMSTEEAGSKECCRSQPAQSFHSGCPSAYRARNKQCFVAVCVALASLRIHCSLCPQNLSGFQSQGWRLLWVGSAWIALS